MTCQLKRSCDSQHYTLALTGLDGWSERPDLDQSTGHVSPLLDLCKNPNECDDCWVSHAHCPFSSWANSYLGNKNAGTK